MLLVAVNLMLLVLGPAKDHKHNWALRHAIYQLLRVNMEIQASTPVALYGFIKNILKILNSPTAVLNVVGKWSDLLRFTDLARTIESGKHAGENKYFVNSEKALPFIQHVDNLINIDDHEELFNYVAR